MAKGVAANLKGGGAIHWKVGGGNTVKGILLQLGIGSTAGTFVQP